MNIKQISFISLFAALTLVLYAFVPLIYLFAFIIISLSLEKNQTLIFGLVIGLLTFLISGRPQTLTNLIWLPLIGYAFKLFELYIYGGYLKEGCLSAVKTKNHLKLALISFVFIIIANLGSEIITMFALNAGLEYLAASSLVILGGALINSLLVGLMGISVQKRLSKFLYTLSK